MADGHVGPAGNQRASGRALFSLRNASTAARVAEYPATSPSSSTSALRLSRSRPIVTTARVFFLRAGKSHGRSADSNTAVGHFGPAGN